MHRKKHINTAAQNSSLYFTHWGEEPFYGCTFLVKEEEVCFAEKKSADTARVFWELKCSVHICVWCHSMGLTVGL